MIIIIIILVNVWDSYDDDSYDDPRRGFYTVRRTTTVCVMFHNSQCTYTGVYLFIYFLFAFGPRTKSTLSVCGAAEWTSRVAVSFGRLALEYGTERNFLRVDKRRNKFHGYKLFSAAAALHRTTRSTMRTVHEVFFVRGFLLKNHC